MTIVEAIKKVLIESNTPLSHKQIYDKIIDFDYYQFSAKDPSSVVRRTLRKHCFGVDFPSASPKKIFVESGMRASNSKPLYILWNGDSGPSKTPKSAGSGRLVEEVIHSEYQVHISSVKKKLLELIKVSDPAFFEKLVVDLLLAMGYGWDNEHSGAVIGGAGDGGIDGIVSEDRLGLENIYIQAKRYVDNSVSPKEIREFVGAMNLKGARKGVFFTSSDFSQQARQHVRDAQNMNVTLINGDALCDYLVRHKMGIAEVGVYRMYEVDKNFFNDD